MRRDTLLDLIKKKELVVGGKVKGSLGCNDHDIVEFRILTGGSRAKTKLTTLDFRRANFGLFRDLFEKSHVIGP